MGSNQLVVVPQTFSLAEQLSAAVEEQRTNAEKTAAMLNQMASALVILDKQVHALSDILDKRVTVSSTQARGIADSVKNHATAICDLHSLEYATAGKPLREAIWRAIRSTYQIPSHYDLPEKYYSSAIDFIENWIPSFSMIKRLREK